MNCQEIKTLKHAYADRELDLIRTTEIEQHLNGCRACSQAYENIRALGSALKSGDLYFKAPAQLKGRIRASWVVENKEAPTHSVAAEVTRLKDFGGKRVFAEIRASLPRLLRFLRHPLGWVVPVAATALITFLVLPALIAPSTDERIEQEATASHVRSLMAAHLTDVASSDQHTVKPWFDGKLDFAPDVKDFAADGFTLVGGRLDYLHGRAVAALVYRHNKHLINVFIWPADGDLKTETETRRGYSIINTTAHNLRYCFISDLNAKELGDLAGLCRK